MERMCGAVVAMILLPFLVQAHTKELAAESTANDQDSRDKLDDMLINRAWPFRSSDLEDTTLAKGTGHLAPSRALSARLQSQTGFLQAAPRRGQLSYWQPAHIAHGATRGRQSYAAASWAADGRTFSNSPPVLLENSCLGDPIVQVEDVPNNAVRIFAGIDVVAPMQSVWEVLTDYENLHRVVPNLVKNEVLTRNARGGARLAQTGSATVLPGLSFTAKMVLDVNVFYEDSPLPDSQISKFPNRLQRGVFPGPFAVTSLPHRDITMSNVMGSPGDFEHYQGVWRIQPLPEGGCAPAGREAARLTYAVEVKPKGFLPIKLIDQRIASDLKDNLEAIRDHVQSKMASLRRGEEVRT
eukprot:gnl/TRDRNA2_/TRDRNA2_186384_c0_seq1.p1 gnl/TRDRNA2_/TRDRNA2_186384_c0~~gnl/TRDRNA2_/TRDRNA2_186384_c0_seq1.p1  ORF type:complete len:354 (+),score=35.10 gnl/TRDRNA2_/TRDRNA2_186384_c0_seq1:66-1127(+)